MDCWVFSQIPTDLGELLALHTGFLFQNIVGFLLNNVDVVGDTSQVLLRPEMASKLRPNAKNQVLSTQTHRNIIIICSRLTPNRQTSRNKSIASLLEVVKGPIYIVQLPTNNKDE